MTLLIEEKKLQIHFKTFYSKWCVILIYLRVEFYFYTEVLFKLVGKTYSQTFFYIQHFHKVKYNFST